MNMKRIYELKISVEPVKTTLFFDSEDAAESALLFFETALTEEARKTLTYSGRIHEVYAIEDVKDALIEVFNPNKE